MSETLRSLRFQAAAAAVCPSQYAFGQAADPPLLTFDEIKRLYQDDDLPAPLRDKLRTLLTTPFVRNNASDAGMMPLKPSDPQTGKMLRVVQWNIERGLEFDAVRFAFSDPKKFNALMEDKGSKAERGASAQKSASRSPSCNRPTCWC